MTTASAPITWARLLQSCSIIGLTRSRLQFAIYFCLHRGGVPENTARRQPRFGQNPSPKNFRQKLYVRQNRGPGALDCSRVACNLERIEVLLELNGPTVADR